MYPRRAPLVLDMTRLLVVLLTVCGVSPVSAQMTATCTTSSSYVVLRQGVTHCGAIKRVDGWLRGGRLVVGDSVEVRLDEVVELRAGENYFRRTADGRRMVRQVSAGRLDRYVYVSSVAAFIPGAADDAEIQGPPKAAGPLFVARSGTAPREATFEVLRTLVGDHTESMHALHAYTSRSRIGLGLSLGGLALMGVGAATTDWKNERPQLSSFLFAGAVVMGASPFLLSGRSRDLNRAIEAYNR